MLEHSSSLTSSLMDKPMQNASKHTTGLQIKHTTGLQIFVPRIINQGEISVSYHVDLFPKINPTEFQAHFVLEHNLTQLKLLKLEMI